MKINMSGITMGEATLQRNFTLQTIEKFNVQIISYFLSV